MTGKWRMLCGARRAAKTLRVGRSSTSRVSTRTGQPIRPVVIAHRGASGYLPEHTLAAKSLAYDMGADYLEQDVVATRDDELVVLHDIHLDRVTDVAKIFPDRPRENGRYYVRDFTLDEIRQLSVQERTNADGTLVYPNRYSVGNERFLVHTFGEELAHIAQLQSENGRPVGIYPEIKSPAWHRKEGVDISAFFLDTLRQYGYELHSDPVYVQCFDNQELVRIRESFGTEMKLIQLIGDNAWGEAETDFEQLLTTEGLTKLSAIADGIGPWVNQLYSVRENGITRTPVVAKAHDLGLAVHPYTYRRDDLPSGFETFAELIRFSVDELCIDGLFTDFPDVALDVLQGN